MAKLAKRRSGQPDAGRGETKRVVWHQYGLHSDQHYFWRTGWGIRWSGWDVTYRC